MNFNEKRLKIEEATVRRPLHPSGKNYHAASLSEADQSHRLKKKGQVFDLTYDKLVIAVGCYSQTFGTPGVRENAFFLKDINDARKIRKRILECKMPLWRNKQGKSSKLNANFIYRFRNSIFAHDLRQIA